MTRLPLAVLCLQPAVWVRMVTVAQVTIPGLESHCRGKYWLLAENCRCLTRWLEHLCLQTMPVSFVASPSGLRYLPATVTRNMVSYKGWHPSSWKIFPTSQKRQELFSLILGSLSPHRSCSVSVAPRFPGVETLSFPHLRGLATGWPFFLSCHLLSHWLYGAATKEPFSGCPSHKWPVIKLFYNYRPLQPLKVPNDHSALSSKKLRLPAAPRITRKAPEPRSAQPAPQGVSVLELEQLPQLPARDSPGQLGHSFLDALLDSQEEQCPQPQPPSLIKFASLDSIFALWKAGSI